MIAQTWRILDINWKKNSAIIFLFGWIMQFVGHYIEGRRPALIDSISQAFATAPLFSLDYILEL